MFIAVPSRGKGICLTREGAEWKVAWLAAEFKTKAVSAKTESENPICNMTHFDRVVRSATIVDLKVRRCDSSTGR